MIGWALALMICGAAQAQLTENWSPVGRLPAIKQEFVGRVPAGQQLVGRVFARSEGFVGTLPEMDFYYVGRCITTDNFVGRLPDIRTGYVSQFPTPPDE